MHINSLDYHLRRHEMAGDDVKHKQDKEYERSVEEEILKRTRKEAEQRAACNALAELQVPPPETPPGDLVVVEEDSRQDAKTQRKP